MRNLRKEFWWLCSYSLLFGRIWQHKEHKENTVSSMFVAYLFIPLPSSGSAAVKLHLTGAILNILQMGKPMLRQLLQVKGQ